MVYFRGILNAQTHFFSWEAKKMKESPFKFFLIDHYASDIGSKYISGT